MHDNPRNEKYPARFENFHPLRSDVPIYVVDFFSRGEGKEKNGKILYVISRNARVKISQGQFEKVSLHPGDNWRGQIHSGRNRKRWNWKYERREDLGFFSLLGRKRKGDGKGGGGLSPSPPRRDQQVWIP